MTKISKEAKEKYVESVLNPIFASYYSLRSISFDQKFPKESKDIFYYLHLDKYIIESEDRPVRGRYFVNNHNFVITGSSPSNISQERMDSIIDEIKLNAASPTHEEEDDIFADEFLSLISGRDYKIHHCEAYDHLTHCLEYFKLGFKTLDRTSCQVIFTANKHEIWLKLHSFIQSKLSEGVDIKPSLLLPCPLMGGELADGMSIIRNRLFIDSFVGEESTEVYLGINKEDIKPYHGMKFKEGKDLFEGFNPVVELNSRQIFRSWAKAEDYYAINEGVKQLYVKKCCDYNLNGIVDNLQYVGRTHLRGYNFEYLLR